jgi:4'-phosphopantetheinyl transferase
VCFENNQAHVSISLSHRAGIGACAIAPAGMMLGCDLEVVEPRSDAFVEDYFTTEEREMLQGKSVAHRFRILALLWSAKESTLKVLRTGLRLDTRCVAITVCDDFRCMTEAPINKAGSQSLSTENWRRFRGCQANDRVFYGWWQERGNVVRTIAAEQPIKPPRVVLVRR